MAVNLEQELKFYIAQYREHIAELESLSAEGRLIQELVDEQAEDEGLWFIARTAPEACLQAALRRLHEVIEGRTGDEIAKDLVQAGQKGYTAEDETRGIKDVDSKSRMKRSKKPGEETSGIKDTQSGDEDTQNSADTQQTFECKDAPVEPLDLPKELDTD